MIGNHHVFEIIVVNITENNTLVTCRICNIDTLAVMPIQLSVAYPDDIIFELLNRIVVFGQRFVCLLQLNAVRLSCQG